MDEVSTTARHLATVTRIYHPKVTRWSAWVHELEGDTSVSAGSRS